ncbi:S1 family peptidase [Actinoplanes subtropicus]|uniref:S1 family peptidase n=1 Tax=Actinoplanes subtropicus TaxID=543632 RepID=UPI0004C2B417|nr:S1 family peptidase [Actinoplanes subtropicus]
MQRRRIAVAAAVVAAAGAAVAFTLPSMAGTTPSSTKPASTRSGVAPQILAAMQRDLGLDGDQATARLKRAKWASGVSATLAAKTGSDFGGAWLATDGTTLKVAVTNAGAADAVRAAGAVPVMVKRSEQTLDAAKEKLDAVRADAAGVSGWYVDVKTNKLVVVAKPGRTAAAKSLAAEAGVKTDAVSVLTSPATPKPLAGTDLHGADPYFISLAEGTARCSIGFAVQGGFVTAGHCGSAGDQTFDQNQVAMGSVKASIFPGDNDEGFVQVTNGDSLQPFVNDFKGNLLPVAGSTEAPVGAAVCRSGSTSGTHCGTIEAKNQTVVYPEGAVTGLTRTNACAESGDSGGPWLAGDQAQGVTSGGSGDCTTGGETFFQPVNEILAINNLTLLTTGGDASTPPSSAPTEEPSTAPTDAADACANLPVQAQGSLNRAGQAQAIPGNGAFRANAGRQVACLDAPAGADFDLFLQRHTATGFRTVAKATGTGDKTLSANLRSGVYRYVVVASAGSGAYTLGFAAP